MKFEILYKRAEEELKQEIEERIKIGWETRGEMQILKPDYGDTNAPRFIYFSQIITKNEAPQN